MLLGFLWMTTGTCKAQVDTLTLPSGRSHFTAVTIPPLTNFVRTGVRAVFLTAEGDTFLTSTGTRVDSLEYVYSMPTNKLSVYDYRNPLVPAFVHDIAVAGGGGATGKTYTDVVSSYFQNANTIWPFQRGLDNSTPVEMSPLNTAYDMAFREVAGQANLLIRMDNNYHIDSYTLDVAGTPVRVAPSPDPLTTPVPFIPGSLVYDDVTGRAILSASNDFNYGAVVFYDVAVNGQVTYNTERQYSSNFSSQGQAFVWNGYYWFWYIGSWVGQPTSGVGPGTGFAFPQYYFGFKPIVVGDYAVMGRSIGDPLYDAVVVVRLTDGSIVSSFGKKNKACKSATVYGTTLIYAVDDTMFTYDITAPEGSLLLSKFKTPTANPEGLTSPKTNSLLGDRGPVFYATSTPVGMLNFRVPAQYIPGEYINTLEAGDASKNVIYPVSITFLKLPTSATEVVSVTRYRYPFSSGGVNIADSCASISGQTLYLSKRWQGSTPGLYRIQAVVKGSNDAVQDEANLLIKVLR